MTGRNTARTVSRRQRSFESRRGLIRYDTVAQKSMAAVKYKTAGNIWIFNAEAIARRYGYFFKHRKDAVLVPVPVHPARLRSRGFNQAGELAVRLGRLTGLPVNERLLVRTKKTAPQKELGPDERLRNLAPCIRGGGEIQTGTCAGQNG